MRRQITRHPGAECQHNLLYWRYQDYAGIGPGAHGRLTLDSVKHAVERRRNPERWLEAVEREGHGTRSAEELDRSERLMELVIMGLRSVKAFQSSGFAR